MSSLLYSLGRWAFAARKLVIALWVVILVAAGGAALAFNQGMDNSISIPGTESQRALDSLATTFPQVSGSSAQIIVVAPDGGSIDSPDVATAIDDSVERLGEISQVAGVISPYDSTVSGAINADRSAGLISIQLDASNFDITPETTTALTEESAALQASVSDGYTVSLGGQLFSSSMPMLSLVELVGVIVALVVLVVTFGSFLAAGMPLLTAMIGVGISMALIFLATVLGPITSTTPMLALMLGLAVGIDYALFIISRHQDQLRSGMDVGESIARSVATAGSAVIFAGLTVIIALLGLSVAGIPFLTTMAVAAAVAVALAVLISITLTPALLGFAGTRLTPKPSRRARRQAVQAETIPAETIPAGAVQAPTVQAETSSTEYVPADPAPAHPNRFYLGWVRAVTRFPLVTVVAVVGLLAVMAAPALGLRLALPDAGGLPEEDPARITFDLVSEEFGPGFNGPLIVTGSIVTSTDPVGLMDELGAEIAKIPGVDSVPLSTPNATADTGIVQVIPDGGPDSEETKTLVNDIRALHDHFLDKYGIDLAVTGAAAVGIDVSDRLGGALLPFALIVVGLSLILLTMVFRSVAVPIKATLGYLLSVAASFGVVALVYEYGWLNDVLNVARTGPVISFMPIIVMGVLFGLAMDYQVFLVARIREDYVHSGKARRSIQTGFLGSAKVVTAAAIIMFAVFAAFVPEGDSSIKTIALGLAVGVFVDAFIVRMTLVPAVLQLLGDKAWWMPRWLDRVLPSFDVEGDALRRELALANWPTPGSTAAVAAEDLSLATPAGPVYSGVSVTVPEGGTLLVRGETAAQTTALLLTLSGRMTPDSGTLKVAGLVMPVRAAGIRSRVAYVSPGGDVVAKVRQALTERPRIIVVDAIESLTEPADRRALHDVLAAGRSAAMHRRASLTVIVGTQGTTTVTELIPDDYAELAMGEIHHVRRHAALTGAKEEVSA